MCVRGQDKLTFLIIYGGTFVMKFPFECFGFWVMVIKITRMSDGFDVIFAVG